MSQYLSVVSHTWQTADTCGAFIPILGSTAPKPASSNTREAVIRCSSGSKSWDLEPKSPNSHHDAPDYIGKMERSYNISPKSKPP